MNTKKSSQKRLAFTTSIGRKDSTPRPPRYETDLLKCNVTSKSPAMREMGGAASNQQCYKILSQLAGLEPAPFGSVARRF
jgi:hypothetical protein